MKPILFSTPMVQAILEGSKTQTRRVVKGTALDWLNQGFTPEFICNEGNKSVQKYSIGDILWVRETWWKRPELNYRQLKDGADTWPKYEYQAEKLMAWDDVELKTLGWKKKPSIYMPKSACRIFLEIANVRAERLQDITEEDAVREGVEFHKPVPGDGLTVWKNYTSEKTPFYGDNAKLSFQTLWQSINGAESWNENPWVWAIEFKQVPKPAYFEK